MVALGALFLRIVPVGLSKTISQMGTLSTEWGKLSKTMGPQVKNLSANFKKFGAIAGAAFGAMLLASPRLRAEMTLLALRTRELVRPFGDALVPVIRTVTDLISGLINVFTSLPEPIQNVITFAAVFAVVVGVVAGALVILPAIFNPVTLAIVGIGLALGVLVGLWNSNWLNIQGIVETVIAFITQTIVTFLGLLTRLPEFVTGVLGTLVRIFIEAGTGIGNAITDLFIKPVQNFIDSVVRFGSQLFEAGVALAQAFFEGAMQVLDAAGSILADVLHFLFGFFGGSLPERGPLVGIPKAGEDIGEAYSLAITRGIDPTVVNESLTRVFQIRNVNVSMPMAGNDPQQFADRMDNGLSRRSTSW